MARARRSIQLRRLPLTFSDLATVRTRPLGVVYAGREWFFYSSPNGRLRGTVSWSKPGLDQHRELEAVADAVLAYGRDPFAMLVDVQHVDGIDPAGFASLGAYGERRRAVLERRVSRLAIVRPYGLTGVVAEGFFKIFPAPCPVEVFSAVEDAVAWLGVTEERDVLCELPAIRARIVGTDPFVLRLRAVLEADPGEASAVRVARELGLSQRAFERRLARANLRFKRERLEARIRVAQRRMRDSDVKLTALALDLGFGSLQHFSNAFRDVTRQSPTEWRLRSRRA